jgi:putative oxidoreductase
MSENVGKLILRLALGLLILLHGIAKIQGGIGGIEGMLAGVGLPAQLAWGVYVGEVVAPILVLLGFYARIGGALIALNMIVAIFLAHRAELLQLTQSGGWALELQGMFLFTAIALMLIGPGRHGLNEK